MAKETKIRRVKAKDSAPKKAEKPAVSKYRAKVEGIEIKQEKRQLPKWLRIILVPFKIIGAVLGFILKPFAKIFAPIGRYLKGSWAELQLVRWPTRAETWKMTGAVLIFSLAFAVLILGLDAFFNWTFNALIKK